ncbi:MAG TPA: CHAT domain-containing protein, partial [Turneriella sp.]|nr:CHAT domain-containing protein [Turneriella sp.]
LNAILDKDIIHYAGHLHYHESAGENGWVLADGKIFYAREFKKSGAQPKLIFCNSCLSARSDQHATDSSWYAHFASAFIRAGRTSYIGTNWELPDRKPTLEFTTHFYDNVFKGKPLGEALQHSRVYAREHFSLNDLTWASYILMGNPQQTVFRSESLLPDVTHNILDPDVVSTQYPYPIADAFKKFHSITTQTEGSAEQATATLPALFTLFERSVFFLSALILANYRIFNFPKGIAFPYPDVQKCLTGLFSALGTIHAIKALPLATNLLETLYVHKENLFKLANLETRFRRENLKKSDYETYSITVQYHIEALLTDLDFLRHYGFYFIVEPGHRQLSFHGTEENHTHRDILLPTQTNSVVYTEILEKTSLLVGRCVFYSPVKKMFLDLSPFMQINADAEGTYTFNFTKAKGE